MNILLILKSTFQTEDNGKRILLIVGIAIAAHLLVLVVKKINRVFYSRKNHKTPTKVLSLSSLFSSMLVFVIYFIAVGIGLNEMNISLSTYIATASVIGIAVGFGTQGIIQDVVTGFTLIISNQIDVEDMVEINGQVGIVTAIGMRFVTFKNALGAVVNIPNRNVNVVINYPKKGVFCHLDINLPKDEKKQEDIRMLATRIAHTVYQKYPNIFVQNEPTLKEFETELDVLVLRIAFKLWPGRGAPVESNIKAELLHGIKQIDESYADWNVAVNYEIETE